jgi:hypothetical protein|tara:strand:+ start:211 stop:1092 length:882 start_codon:yes stop_codon:yes gene_type:complete
MKTVNSLSGGKTSSYIAANYPADYNLFCLVTTKDKNCLFPDKKLRQVVSDKIGREFIGTLEEDAIIHTMLDLEQMIGNKINWINEFDFDDLTIRHQKNGEIKHYVPNVMRRICTVEMKIIPMAKFIVKNIGEVVETRIGFRANETRRANNMIARLNSDGIMEQKIVVGKHKNGNNKWQNTPYQIPRFPLIEDNIYKDKVEKYWEDKNVRFAYMNNCVGCFHRNEVLLKHMSVRNPNKFDWFVEKEKKAIQSYNKSAGWKAGIGPTYEEIKKSLKQLDLFDEDFNDCDSGYCGI